MDVENDLVAIDIKLSVGDSDGVAYFRMTPQMRDFFKLCEEKHGVIGFQYDRESLNLGFILGIKNRDKPEV